MMELLNQVLQGVMPATEDAVSVRAALLSKSNLYLPTNLKAMIARMDVDVSAGGRRALAAERHVFQLAGQL